jgi:hypothetical protein
MPGSRIPEFGIVLNSLFEQHKLRVNISRSYSLLEASEV